VLLLLLLLPCEAHKCQRRCYNDKRCHNDDCTSCSTPCHSRNRTTFKGLLKHALTLNQSCRCAAAGTVEDTADELTRRGGKGIPVVCDHTVDAQVHCGAQVRGCLG
jgi:hypothetical protein